MAILIDGTVPVPQAVIFRTGLDGPHVHTDVVNFENVTITKITFFNKIQTIQTIVLFVKKKFGELRKLRQYVLMQNQSAEYLAGGEFLPLEAGDDIFAEATTEDAVDFVVYGDVS